jgi:hypothetical protein
MPRQSKKLTSDPEIDRLVKEAAHLKAKSDAIIERMILLNKQIAVREAAREAENRARDKPRK